MSYSGGEGSLCTLCTVGVTQCVQCMHGQGLARVQAQRATGRMTPIGTVAATCALLEKSALCLNDTLMKSKK